MEPPPDAGVFALGVLADAQDVHVPRAPIAKRAGDAVEHLDRAEVDVLVEAGGSGAGAPQRHVVRDGGEAHRAEVDRVVVRQHRQAVGGIIRPVSRYQRQDQGSVVVRSVNEPVTAPARARTRSPSGITSCPMPSPGITAMR